MQGSEPFSPAEDHDGSKGGCRHYESMYPKSIRITIERYADAHSHDTGIDAHWESDSREYSENLHSHIEFVGKQGVIGFFERLNNLFVVFENVPKTNIGSNKVLEIYFKFGWHERTFFLDDGFNDGSLWFECSSKIQYVSFKK